MYVELEDFKTGWYGITISVQQDEIDILIEQLKKLKKDKNQHFHLSSDYKGDSGIGDIEFNIQENEVSNMTICGFAIPPKRGSGLHN